jgi:hypothetical protein
MPGARCTRSLACEIDKSTRASHHRFTETVRHSLRDGFNGSFVLSPVTGLFCHRRRRNCFRQLDASVGASGPHDFAVRIGIARLATPTRPSRPAPNVRGDCAYAPLSGAGRRKLVAVICPTAQAEYFCEGGLDDPNHVDPLQQFAVCAQARSAAGRVSPAGPRKTRPVIVGRRSSDDVKSFTPLRTRWC